jgi:hypothetical protein
MKPYHKACRSTDLDIVVEKKGNREIHHDHCKNCLRVIEPYEIIRPTAITRCIRNLAALNKIGL